MAIGPVVKASLLCEGPVCARSQTRAITVRTVVGLRAMSAKSAKSSSSDLGQMHALVRDMLGQEQGKGKGTSAVSLPSGWEHVDATGLIEGQSEVGGIVLLEKRLATGEIVNLVSSHEVVNRDDDMEEDDEEGEHENGFKHSEVSILFLAAVDKPGASLPLFFECVGDRYGYEILRVHVGLGMAGFMSDHSGHPSLLYHAYMSHKDSREGSSNVVPGELSDDAPDSACSPEFDTLDARLQGKFVDFLSEKHVDAVVVEALFDLVDARGHERYVAFLEQLDAWLK